MKSGLLIFPGLLVYGMILLSACNQVSEETTNGGEVQTPYKVQSNEFASGFITREFTDHKELIVRDPEDTLQEFAHYHLYPHNSVVPEDIRPSQVIRTPVRSFACLSTTQLAFFESLNARNFVKGISDPEYVCDSIFREMIDNGEIADLGRESGVNEELLIQTNPQLILVFNSGIDAYDNLDKYRELGLQQVLIQEFKEKHPLGQAEWIRFIGALIGKDSIADVHFSGVSKEYREVRSLAGLKSSLPMVFTGIAWQGQWTVPGGRSFAARYLNDAGAHYIFNEDMSSGSFIVDLETMLEKASKAKYWLNPGAADNFEDILAIDERYALFNAFQEGRVFNNNARLNEFGGNDYWESAVTNPHLVLKDLVSIFHPDLLPDHKLLYYKQLEQP